MLAQASCRVIGVPYNSAVQSRSALPVTPARCSLVLTPLRCHRARQITAPRVRRSLAIVQASSAIAAPVPSQYGKLGMPLYQIMHLEFDSTWFSIVHYTHPWGVAASLLCGILRCGVAPQVPPAGLTRLTFLPAHVCGCLQATSWRLSHSRPRCYSGWSSRWLPHARPPASSTPQ